MNFCWKLSKKTSLIKSQTLHETYDQQDLHIMIIMWRDNTILIDNLVISIGFGNIKVDSFLAYFLLSIGGWS